jgi:hypothetical protein
MAAWDELLEWLPEMAGLTVLDSSATSVSMHIDRGNGRTHGLHVLAEQRRHR